VTRDAYLKKQPDAVDALLNGWFRALKYIKESPEDAHKRLGVRQKLTPAEVIDAYSRMKLVDLPENRDLLAATPPALARSGQRLADHMFAQKLLSRPVQAATLIDPGPVSRAKPK
jgi:NitT/TauT family transport system substrate-binding protein